MGKQPKYPVGTRITVSDLDAIRNYGGILPMVGWVVSNEELFSGKQHMGWMVHIRGDHEPRGDWDTPVRWHENQVSNIPLKRYGRQLRHRPAIDCPYCLEHGRDPRITEPYVVHPQIPDCQCWHHTHEEHLPDCPYGH